MAADRRGLQGPRGQVVVTGPDQAPAEVQQDPGEGNAALVHDNQNRRLLELILLELAEIKQALSGRQ